MVYDIIEQLAINPEQFEHSVVVLIIAKPKANARIEDIAGKMVNGRVVLNDDPMRTNGVLPSGTYSATDTTLDGVPAVQLVNAVTRDIFLFLGNIEELGGMLIAGYVVSSIH